MQWIVWPIKFDNKGIFIEFWRQVLATSHRGHGPSTVSRLGVASTNAGSHGCAVLTSCSLDAVKLCRVTLQVVLCRDPTHAAAIAHGACIGGR